MTTRQQEPRVCDTVDVVRAPVRVVVLDFFRTLAYRAPWPTDLNTLVAPFVPAERCPAFWAQWFGRAFDGREHRAQSVSRAGYVQYERELRRGLQRAAGIPPAAADEILTELERLEATTPLIAYPDALPFLRALGGVRVIVCSNWGWDLDRALEQTGLDTTVHAAISSARVGARKPHPLVYRAVLEAAGATPGEVLFVGDSWHADVQGPRAHGMRAVQLCREGLPGPSAGPDRIATLGELIPIILPARGSIREARR
ncbi:HAD family hydrolase [Streptomyces sp. NPDC059629]|uniref:HAD family hydrolase n=1 Tax=Streptomyces sp. NPDC059629 TaxID=3346889 RepID=UPI0036978DB6